MIFETNEKLMLYSFNSNFALQLIVNLTFSSDTRDIYIRHSRHFHQILETFTSDTQDILIRHLRHFHQTYLITNIFKKKMNISPPELEFFLLLGCSSQGSIRIFPFDVFPGKARNSITLLVLCFKNHKRNKTLY